MTGKPIEYSIQTKPVSLAPPREQWIAATLSIIATMLSFGSIYVITHALNADPGAGILSAAFAVTLGRRHSNSSNPAWTLEMGAFPVIGLGAMAVRWLIHHALALGAAAFVTVMAGAIWLRRFGSALPRLGAVTMFLLVAMLVVPVPTEFAGVQWIRLLLALMADARQYPGLIQGLTATPPS